MSMTHLDEISHKAQMDDMRSFDEPMPSVGIFWYAPEDHTLFGVREKGLTPREVEEATEITIFIPKCVPSNRAYRIHLKIQ